MRKRYYIFLLSVFLLNWICFFTASASDLNGSHFYFVQITDTHFGDDNHIERTKKIVNQINNLPFEIKCVVHTGDIIMNKLDEGDTAITGLNILKKIQVPVHYIPGNHDILQKNRKTSRQAYMKYFGKLISQSKYGNVTFIFLYTEPLAKGFDLEGYNPMKLLESLLIKNGDTPVIIFHHRPAVENFYNNKMHAGWNPEIRNKWIKLINTYEVKAVIAGHFHRDEHHWLGEVPLFISPPVAGYYGRQAAFRIYEYKNGKIGYRTQYVE
jgi:predicted MPP superfamily phosphohydrolase